jgi:hypothetical protein
MAARGTPLLHQDASGRQGCAVSGRLAKRIKYAMPSPRNRPQSPLVYGSARARGYDADRPLEALSHRGLPGGRPRVRRETPARTFQGSLNPPARAGDSARRVPAAIAVFEVAGTAVTAIVVALGKGHHGVPTSGAADANRALRLAARPRGRLNPRSELARTSGHEVRVGGKQEVRKMAEFPWQSHSRAVPRATARASSAVKKRPVRVTSVAKAAAPRKFNKAQYLAPPRPASSTASRRKAGTSKSPTSSPRKWRRTRHSRSAP